MSEGITDPDAALLRVRLGLVVHLQGPIKMQLPPLVFACNAYEIGHGESVCIILTQGREFANANLDPFTLLV